MNSIVKFLLVILIAFFIHMILNAVGIEMSFYITYLVWFVVLGIFLVALPEGLPNILKQDDNE
jgi:hypothetical protein